MIKGFILLRRVWVEFSIAIFFSLGILSLIYNKEFQSLSHIVLLLIGIASLFVASSLDKIKIILFLGQNKHLLTKAQLLIYFFAALIIFFILINLDIFQSLRRWD